LETLTVEEAFGLLLLGFIVGAWGVFKTATAWTVLGFVEVGDGVWGAGDGGVGGDTLNLDFFSYHFLKNKN
jgi:hypothetical protein